MADVKKIMGIEVASISDIYDSPVNNLSHIMGIGMNISTYEPSTDFVFDGGYTPPNGDVVDFF